MSIQAPRIVEIGNGFYNIRSPFKVLCNCIDVGTHMSLIKLNSGNFLIVDTIEIAASHSDEPKKYFWLVV
jgi:hypothetical protein